MKIKTIILAVALATGTAANAQGLGDLLKGLGSSQGSSQSDLGSTIGNVLSGIFAKSDLTVADIAGQYESTGPAVTFKSDNFLQKAGGIAGAAALETKLNPYYDKYGLNGMTLSIAEDGQFTLKVKGIPLQGEVVAREDKGEFTFNILAVKSVKLGQFTAYIQKSGKNIDLMFDATKLKELVSTIGKLSGMTIAKTMGTLLDSYDGANIGFKMTWTGEAPEPQQTSWRQKSGSVSKSTGSGSQTGETGSATQTGEAVGNLLNILNGNRKK